MRNRQSTTGSSRRRPGRWAAVTGAIALACATATAPPAQAAADGPAARRHISTSTPVQHLVVIFDENISFDHYFGTYPYAANTDGTRFTPDRRTPKDIDNLRTADLLEHNPNLYPPRRLSQAEAVTCDQNHNYSPEQRALNGGAADRFVQNTERDRCSGGLYGEPGLVMDYYDGNTVTALWNYAQHYTLGDRSFSDVYGPSTPGAISLISGQTHGVVSMDPDSGTENPRRTTTPDPSAVKSPDANGVGTMITDPEPAYDDCADDNHTTHGVTAAMTGRNVGDLLNARRVTWGWFQGGFRPSTPWPGEQGTYAACDSAHANINGTRFPDYDPHHNPFAYYRSTANPHHLSPSSVAAIGSTDRANHNYDLSDFDAALKAGNLPAVSFLKAGKYQDGHAGKSDPLDEQHFLVREINALQNSPEWSSTAVVVAYDDSDGWYDHVYHRPVNGSTDTAPDSTGAPTDAPACQSGPAPAHGYQDRCGPGARQPLLVVSPYSRVNHIDHTYTTQSSILRFIEDNWRTGRIGDASFDAGAGTLLHAFDFRRPQAPRLLLREDGSVASVSHVAPAPPGSATLQQLTPVADARPASSPNLLVPAGLAAAATAVCFAALRRVSRRRRS
ncbi:phospholipase C [Streptomyces sp. NPDC014805]|uniref:phospholipase C n=1 Tax=Streptomyces sp. NPDC014805 TaxID=3364919 RepID=UPI0036FBB10D